MLSPRVLWTIVCIPLLQLLTVSLNKVQIKISGNKLFLGFRNCTVIFRGSGNLHGVIGRFVSYDSGKLCGPILRV